MPSVSWLPGAGRLVLVALVALVPLTLASCQGTTTMIVFDGQSLNNHPNPPDNYPSVVMHRRFESWVNVAVGGASWEALAASAPDRVFPHASGYDRAVIVLCGGTTNSLAGDTAEQIYGKEVEYARAARAAGFDLIVTTTLVEAGPMTDEQDVQRAFANELKRQDPLDAFDAVIDLAADLGLDTPRAPNYFDGVHWTKEGAALAASIAAPVIDELLRTHSP